MKDKQIKYMNSLALKQMLGQGEDKTYQSIQVAKFYRKLSACGTHRNLKNGGSFRTRCYCAICPNCSREYSRAQSKQFVKNFDNLDKNSMRYMTLVIALTTDIEKVYTIFDSLRVKVRKGITNRCNRKGPSSRLWRQVGLSGSCEIDSFMSEDFDSLGSKKKHQYGELLGYVPPLEGQNVPVFVVTAHILVRLGRLSLKSFSEFMKNLCPYVHFRKLDEKQDSTEAVQNCLGYASKIDYKTELKNNTFKLWNFEQISALSDLISRSKGRRSLGFSVKPKRNKKSDS